MKFLIRTILHLTWESVILAHRESPQQEVGRSEGWQPLLWVYGQHQDHCMHVDNEYNLTHGIPAHVSRH